MAFGATSSGLQRWPHTGPAQDPASPTPDPVPASSTVAGPGLHCTQHPLQLVAGECAMQRKPQTVQSKYWIWHVWVGAL